MASMCFDKAIALLMTWRKACVHMLRMMLPQGTSLMRTVFLDLRTGALLQIHPMMKLTKKIVEIHFSRTDVAEKATHYFVMTGVAGYVNTYTHIAQRPNAQLVFSPERPLGQYSLSLKLVVDVQAEREILIAYGPRHVVKEKRRAGPKMKKFMTSAGQAE